MFELCLVADLAGCAVLYLKLVCVPRVMCSGLVAGRIGVKRIVHRRSGGR